MPTCHQADSSDQAAALTLFQTELRDGDVGGVVVSGRVANGRLTSDRAELIRAVKDAKPNPSVLSAQMEERLWPRLSAVEAVRIFVNDDKEMMDMATRRGCDEQRSACEGPAGDDPVRSMLHGKASQFSANIRVEATRTLAMLQSVLTGLGRLEGPKNVLLMSEGFISEETWPEVQDAVGRAALADTRIYTLDARGLGRGMASVDSVAPAEGLSRMFEQMDMGADSINSLAVDTGGFVVRNTNQFDKAIAQIADDAANYYVLRVRAAVARRREVPQDQREGEARRRERACAPRLHGVAAGACPDDDDGGDSFGESAPQPPAEAESRTRQTN